MLSRHGGFLPGLIAVHNVLSTLRPFTVASLFGTWTGLDKPVGRILNALGPVGSLIRGVANTEVALGYGR